MINLEQKVCGFYKIEAFKRDKSGNETSRRVVADWFPNLITDIGLSHMFANGYIYSYDSPRYSGILKHCMVGAGNTTPSTNDSVLDVQLAHTNTYMSHVATTEKSSPYYRKYIIKYRFGEGVAEGNVAEVGVGWKVDATYYCFSRALILDTNGNPTVITVLNDEWLDITYEYRIYPKETDDTGTVVFSGDIGGTYDWIARLANVVYWALNVNGYPQLSMGQNSKNYYTYTYASSADISNISTQPTTNYNAKFMITQDMIQQGLNSATHYYSLGLTQGNIPGGVRSFVVGVGSCWYQIQFDNQASPGTGIPKTDTDILTFKFKVSWGRV